jgi:hypothetical protein
MNSQLRGSGSRSLGGTPTAGNALAASVSIFAAVMLVMTGAFQMLQGLSAILEDTIFVSGLEYTFEIDVTTWGWIHLALGALAVAIGIGIFSAQTWALVAGIVVAALQALSQFMFLPYYPFWAILLIALDVLVIWALANLASRS